MDVISYMRAHLRINSIADVSKFTNAEVIESFALLPMPKIPIDEWVSLLNIYTGNAEETEEIEDPKKQIDPVERLKTEDAHLFESGIVRLGA